MRPAVLIAARDEQEQLGAALATVAGWATERLVVLDPRTTDASREVAEAAGARVLEHRFEGMAAQLNWGLEQIAAPWTFVLDADERVSDRLRAAVDRVLDQPGFQAYEVRRVNLAFGRRLRFGDWGADRVVRLIETRGVRFSGEVHGAVVIDRCGRLEGEVEHHTLRDLGQYLVKLHDQALRGGAALAARGRRSGPLIALARAEWRFVRAYVLRGGVLDGGPGLVVAVLAAHATFLKWTAAWQLGQRPR